MERGVAQTARVTAGWASQIAKACKVDEPTPKKLASAIDKAAKGFDLEAFASVVERRILHGIMLGALDSLWERETEEEVQLETFKELVGQTVLFEGGQPRSLFDSSKAFARLPYQQAIALFEKRRIVTRKQFDRLRAETKRRSFTIAGLAQKELRQAAHAELTRQLKAGAKRGGAPATKENWRSIDRYQGASLRQFSKFVEKRLVSAGWTPANPSHVETIYRTNIMSAYSAGRFAEMSDPEVLKHRPYWQIMTVRDARQRPTHRAAHGVVLPAAHPFWSTAFPPFGYNCFPAGTPVTTARGRVPIEQVQLGERVLTHAGRWMPVNWCDAEEHAGELVVLEMADGTTVEATEDHLFLTTRGWKRAGDLTQSDELVDQPESPALLPEAIHSVDEPSECEERDKPHVRRHGGGLDDR